MTKEITLKDLRKLISKLNKDDKIIMSRNGKQKKKAELIEELKKIKYRVDHENKKLIPTVEMKRKKIIKL